MKNLLLSLSAFVLGAVSLLAAPTARAGQAEDCIDFTLAGPRANSYQINNARVGTIVYLAFEFVPQYSRIFDGAQITAVSFYSAENRNTRKNDINDIEVFIIPEANGKDYNPIVSKSETIGTKANAYTTITFDTPYTISKDETFAVGYTFTIAATGDLYMASDDVLTDKLEGCWVATGAPGRLEWMNLASTIGKLCIYATITGDNLPRDGVSVPLVAVPGAVEPGKDFTADITLRNEASNSVSSVELEYSIGGGEPATTEITLPHPISFGQNYTATLAGLTCDRQQPDVTLSVAVTKVNDQPNTNINATGTATFNCYDFASAYPHTYLLEEGTGTWCGFCPIGIVALEYVNKNYPDHFAGIAIHTRDVMAMYNATDILAFLDIFSFPNMVIDRTMRSGMSEAEFDRLAGADAKSIATVAGLEGKIDSDGNIAITSSVRFLMDTRNADDRFRMSYYITENGVGPYDQTNTFAGGGSGEMAGWEDKPYTVSTIYNDVARELIGKPAGIPGSIPANIKAGETYEHYIEAATYDFSSNPFFVTAFIIDNNTGAVVNSRQEQMVVDETGLTDAVASRLTVLGSEGAIIVHGEYTAAAVYNVAGQLVATAAGESSIALPAGLYIVKADTTTAKVAVK